MAFTFSATPRPPSPRRLRPRTIVRRCVGGMILLVGACLLTMDLIALVRGAMG